MAKKKQVITPAQPEPPASEVGFLSAPVEYPFDEVLAQRPDLPTSPEPREPAASARPIKSKRKRKK
jgi:hypothetical protein